MSLRQGPHQTSSHDLLRCIAHSSQLADEQVLSAFEHLLLAERKRLGTAKRNKALQDSSHFHQRSSPHPLGILLKAVLPVMMASRAALLEVGNHVPGLGR